MFFVYVDSTDNDRPFYVGKGNSSRVRFLKRNTLHTNISRKHGANREIVLITSVERVALDHEIDLIAELKTQHGLLGHWGANLCAGGEGLSNPSLKVRIRMSTSQRKRRPDSEETRQKKRQSAIRLGSQPEIRQIRSVRLKGRIRSSIHCANISRVHQKPIEQLNHDGVVIATFPSGMVAEKVTKISRSKICMCCRGKRQYAGGYGWRYKT